MHTSINNRIDIFLKTVHPCFKEIFYKLYISKAITLRPFLDRGSLVKLARSDFKYTYAYRLHISYATRILFWDIIFNPHDLTSAPDFDFNDEAFEDFIHRNNKHIPLWDSWDLQKPESLELLIQFFIRLFTQYQENELQRVGAFIAEEYQLATSLESYKRSEVEVFVDVQSTNFLITLHVDMSQLPEYLQQVDEGCKLLNPLQDYALLAIYYHDNEAKGMSSQLYLCPRLNQLLGNDEGLNIPYYTNNTSLMNYIPEVTEILQKHIDHAALKFQFKKEFIASLLVLRSKSIIEYDAFYMKYLTFLCEVDRSYFLVHVEIGDNFPQEKAVVEIISFHNFGSNLQLPEKFFFQFEDSPELIPDKLAVHFLDQLKNHIINKYKLSNAMITE